MEGNQTKAKPSEAQPQRLLDQVRDAIRRRHYSPRTEEAYVRWIKRFIHFSDKHHPKELGAAEVTAFLNYLAGERDVAASTQNQALSALLFLYKDVDFDYRQILIRGVKDASRAAESPST